jgi:hypothetical protein
MGMADKQPLTNWECRRTTLVLASQLPPDRTEAMLVIEGLRQLVEDYWAPEEGHPFRRDFSVVEGSPSGMGASPKSRAMLSDKPPV